MDIVIPLIGDSFSLQNLFMNLEGENLFGELKEFSLLQNKAVMSIDWRDQGVPKLKKEFWETFVGILKKESEKRPINVLFFCVGGHGRTGTALSIVCHLLEFSTGDPIEWVRKNYCKEAVESYSQVSYIEEILGITTFAQVAPTLNWKGRVFDF